ncbi:AraC-like DNA-binding protein [Anaerobacterium chartisolvens]|uniref:AraC-like DNA-binding protein n=1 Tax=Anaerobacterium chartisolvens TaxID=1297424 RepID=A0A369B7M4_9FIRM|nr:helix-turn-helix domain-containing protein [Anaerobacterium chartisolvens]RCX17520.1 AraC-like DNA-binding protein [Anaerobacterium chartisolvens]
MKLLPQSFTSFKMNSIFIRIFFSITGLVLASVFIVSNISYRNSTDMMINEVKGNNMLLLKQIQESIDREVNFIKSSAMQASLDHRLIKALYISHDDSYYEAELYRDIITYLNSIKVNNDYITNLWVYFNKADIVLGSEGKYDSQLFFSKVCKYNSNINWEEVFHEYSPFHSAGRQEVEYDFTKMPVVMFTKSLPVNEFRPKGTLVVNLDEQFFYKVMEGNKEGKVIINYIIDSDKNIIFTNDKLYQENKEQELARSVLYNTQEIMDSDEGTLDTKFDGKPFTVQYIKSGSNDWTYISITPTGYISRRVNGIRDVTLFVAIMSMIFSVVLTYLLVKRLYSPINDILNYISIVNNKKLDKQKAESKDELKFINRIISYVYNENESLRDSFNKSHPILREKLLNDITGGRVTQERYREIGSDMGIDMPFPLFQIIVFEIDEYGSEVLKRHRKMNLSFVAKIDEIAGEALNENARCYSVQKDESNLVSIINANEMFYEAKGINEYLNKVRDYFVCQHDLTFTIGVGRPYSSMEECSMSFTEALYSLKYKIVKGQNTVIYIDEVKEIAGSIFEYPMEKEKKLVTILKSGDIASANEILLQIFTDNLSKRSMAPEMINNLFNALVGTAIRSIYEMQSSIIKIFGEGIDIYAEMSAKSLVEEKKSYVYFIFKCIASYAGDRKRCQNTKVYEKVKAFVAENYNGELSLERVAEVVQLSPSYLSFIFKEISGTNFVDFINEYRLEKAKDLLKSSSMTVAQVAEAVGYINANSFSKTFKRYIGVSPGQFREM